VLPRVEAMGGVVAEKDERPARDRGVQVTGGRAGDCRLARDSGHARDAGWDRLVLSGAARVQDYHVARADVGGGDAPDGQELAGPIGGERSTPNMAVTEGSTGPAPTYVQEIAPISAGPGLSGMKICT